MGMTYEQYWYGDVWMVKAFREADKINQQRVNYQMWLQGLYVYDAFSTVMKNAFSKQGASPALYPTEPYPLFQKEKARQQEDQGQEDAETLRAKVYMMNMVRAGKDWGKQ